jgi:general stress protein 26
MADARTAVEQLNELISKIQFAMLTTIRPDGTLHSCPMATQEVDSEGNLWFFTRTDTEKVEALRSNKRVCVSYADPDGQRYVSVTGTGDLIRSEPKAKELWNPLYKAWFPQGLDDANLILIKVLIEDAEYWHAPEGRMVQLVGFAKAALTGTEYRPAGHKEIEFPKNKINRNL